MRRPDQLRSSHLCPELFRDPTQPNNVPTPPSGNDTGNSISLLELKPARDRTATGLLNRATPDRAPARPKYFSFAAQTFPLANVDPATQRLSNLLCASQSTIHFAELNLFESNVSQRQ